MGRNPNKFLELKKKKNHPGGRKEKKNVLGVSQFEILESLPCKMYTQWEGFAFLTNSQVTGTWAAGGGRVRVPG